ncbi:hypothetical protein VTN00DRAFT_3364 [Thermoascus crustaceus]|uniref:uncharacterized protein n=1 Tax=Thermoascus crustaceus TaxID=5088 RepID=UPI0037443956
MIEDSITDDKLKKNVSWGFVVYRCTYSDDGAWQQMLQLIRDGVKSSLEAEGRMDLLPRHELIVMDDKARFDGATSHEIRDQFHRWVADEMMNRLAEPKEPDREAMLRSRPDDPGPEWFLGARYNFCLFVDNICLESLEKMRRPVVKLLWKQWGPREPNEREYPVHPDWEDGETDEEEEDVGWMYMAVTDYVEWYDLFHEPEHWYDAYSRPPSMIGADTSEETPGFWRKG